MGTGPVTAEAYICSAARCRITVLRALPLNCEGGMSLPFPSKFPQPGIFRMTPFLICVGLIFIGFLVAGCNSCFLGVINSSNNPPMMITGNPPLACSQLQPVAHVNAIAHLAQACTGCSTSRQVTHVHLFLSGMELHPDAVTAENSPEWQELAPDWARQPQWVELGEDPNLNVAALPLKLAGQIPAGTYHQLRLRLAQPSSRHTEEPHGESPCFSVDASCVVTADGSFHALQTLDGNPYLRVEATSPIDLHTDQPNLLHIELRPEWALQNPSNGFLDLMPLLRGHVAVEPSSAAGPF
jgi:hypothetical protein